MTQSADASLSFAELRDALKARTEELGHSHYVNLNETLSYLTALPDGAHTPDSIDALIQLARNFFFAAQPVEGLEAASVASRLAALADENLLLGEAKGLEGLCLSDLGRFTEATVAHAESWRLARMLGNVELEGWATKRVGDLWAAMAQFDVAMTYLNRARELAAEHGLVDLERASRNNIANYAIQIKDPVVGLRVLVPLARDAPNSWIDILRQANAHDTLGHLYWLTDDLDRAAAHAQESGRLAKLAGVERTIKCNEALLGLIDVKSGAVERGLAAVERVLAFARQVDQVHVVAYLGMCADAYEVAGQSDKALEYLKELVEWKRKSLDIEVVPLQYEGLADSVQLQALGSAFDDTLLSKSQRLQAGVQQRIQHLVETSINAEAANSHDLYRTFRVAKLARCLATAQGWDEERIAPLTLGGQLCNIGMTAIPARILQKKRGLSDGELQVMRAHTQYGGELLRKSKLRMLNVAATVAEQHHERYDGSGYPRGLCGEAIAEEARIVAICDAFDAMRHPRPWRSDSMSIQAALNELKQGAGRQFDDQFVDTFIELIRREFWEHDDFDAFLAEGADQLEYIRARTRMEALIASGR